MEFPPDWACFGLDEFELAAARNPMNCGVELLVQARPSGRLLDHFRLVLGGDQLIEAKIPFKTLVNLEEVPDWNLYYGVWPRAIKIRRNMTCSDWLEVRDLISSNDARVELNEGGTAVDSKDALQLLDGLNEKGVALRWCVAVGDDRLMKLVLQALPASASSFNGKPVFRG